MNVGYRFSVFTLSLVAAAMTGLAPLAATAQQVFGEFVGINIHQGAIHQAGRQDSATVLYNPVQNLVRDYHNMSWDVDAPTNATKFPFDKWNWINWSTDYGKWVATGTQVNACIMIENFPNASSWGANPEATAFTYGAAFARAFGPTVGSGKVTSVQIGNEPGDVADALYKQVFRGMASGIRSVDPALIIVTCNVEDAPSGTYHKNINLFSDITDLVDAYATHSYPMIRAWPTYEKSYPEDTGMSYLTKVQAMHAWVQANDPTAQSWITEFGYDASSKTPTGDFLDVTDTQQAQWLVRSYMAWADIGLDRAYMYYYNDSDSYSLHACAGLTRNWSPKPSYYAQSHMLDTLEDYRFDGVVRKDAGQLYVFRFVHITDPTDIIYAFWSPTGNGRQVTVTLNNLPGAPAGAERMPLTSGAAPQVGYTVLSANSVQIQATESPTYLFLSANSGNAAPVVDAGSDQTITTPQDTVNLAGSATDDGNPNPPGQLAIAWSKISGPGTVTFGNPAAAATTATFSTPGVYVLRLAADDGQFVLYDEVTITYNSVPHLAYTASDLGGGLMGYAFKIRNNDGLLQSYALTVAFEAMDTATIHQMKAFGAVRVDREEDATNYSAMPTANYVKAEDTWVFSPFSNNGIPGVSPLDGTTFSGFVEGPSDAYYMLSAGSGSGSQLGDNVSAVYVVCDGNVSWTGVLARIGVSYPVSGVTETVVVVLPGDYNGDGYVDLADYTIWADNYGQTGSGIPGDGNNDGVVDLADYTVWADHYGQGTPAAMTAGDDAPVAAVMVYGTPVSGGASQGDFNGDGFVDQADYTLWADGDASADANGDGVVDLADYTVWADNL